MPETIQMHLFTPEEGWFIEAFDNIAAGTYPENIVVQEGAAAAAISPRSLLRNAIRAEDDTLAIDVDPSVLGVALVEVALLVDSRYQGDEYA